MTKTTDKKAVSTAFIYKFFNYNTKEPIIYQTTNIFNDHYHYNDLNIPVEELIKNLEVIYNLRTHKIYKGVYDGKEIIGYKSEFITNINGYNIGNIPYPHYWYNKCNSYNFKDYIDNLEEWVKIVRKVQKVYNKNVKLTKELDDIVSILIRRRNLLDQEFNTIEEINKALNDYNIPNIVRYHVLDTGHVGTYIKSRTTEYSCIYGNSVQITNKHLATELTSYIDYKGDYFIIVPDEYFDKVNKVS